MNVDQVPFMLDESPSTTYEESGTARVWVKGCSKKDDKRTGTLQICVRLKDGVKQPRIGLIFRGKGTVERKEYHDYDERVYVAFQESAWADDKYCQDWAAGEFLSFWDEIDPKAEIPKLLFLDNLSGHNHPHFKRTLLLANTETHMLPAKCTDELQVSLYY